MSKENRWFLPTNTENLKGIIAQGLISGSDGLDKYYQDVLENYPGYIPLYNKCIPKYALTKATQEVPNLTLCLLEIELKNIEITAKTIQDNQWIDTPKVGNYEQILLLAPLPLSCIKSVIFESNEKIKEFENEQKLYSNLILDGIKLQSTKVDKKLFSALKQESLEIKAPAILQLTNSVNYTKVYAFGGLLANLFYFAKNGRKSNGVYQSFCQNFASDAYPEISYYFATSVVDQSSEFQNIYNGILNGLNQKTFKDDIVYFLESNTNQKTNKRSAEIANRLREFEGHSTKPVSEQLSNASKLEKVLLMLFHREDTQGLIDYNFKDFSESDYLSFALMFGIRDKFSKLPAFLKRYSGLQNFISEKMAEYAHITIEHKIVVKTSNKPLTIMEMLEKDLIKKRLIKSLKVETCIQTIMPKKPFHHDNGQNTYSGFVEPSYRIIEDEYFKVLNQRVIAKEDYNKFAKLK